MSVSLSLCCQEYWKSRKMDGQRERNPAQPLFPSVNQQMWWIATFPAWDCVWNGQTLTICYQLLTLLSNTVYTHLHTHACRAVGLPLVTQSGLTVHSGCWTTWSNLFIFLPWTIITRTKYQLLTATVYSDNNRSLMSGRTLSQPWSVEGWKVKWCEKCWSCQWVWWREKWLLFYDKLEQWL